MVNLIKISLFILIICFFSSCSARSLINSRLDMLSKSTDEEIANARLEQVLEAIQNQNKEALRALFSENASNEADDFDGNVERLFGFFQGEV